MAASGNSVLVTNLPFAVTESELYKYMSIIGPVRAVHLGMNGQKSKGFGVVEFESADNVEVAFKMDGAEILGRKICVRENAAAAPKKPVPPRQIKPAAPPPDARPRRHELRQLYVSGVPDDTQWTQLKDFLAQHYHVAPAYVNVKHATSRDPRGFTNAIVRFDAPEDAAAALAAFDGLMFRDAELHVKMDAHS
eukprot:gnl/Chilomastix_cuspidata/3845.p1 GENE.gnl/Chilomastix_cuspidata/3845~~gnl/Chilomastix_cuspidata/3845.p1  ORF type:complete len:193 (-),score=52.76 gnl/Chilomastix_cuspidata/3845:159-737(-)